MIAGLESAELVIVQDVFTDTATNAYADILLPATLWVEAEGVMVNSDRTMTLVPRVTEAPGDAMPDWLTICRVAQAMGFDEGFAFGSSEEVFDEIRRFWNPQTGWDVRGVTYERLRRGPVQWPAPPDDAEDRHPIRYVNDGVSQSPAPRDRRHDAASGVRDAVPSRAVLREAPSRTARAARRRLSLVLNTGRLQHQWHTMTKTGKVDKLVKLNPKPFVEIHPLDAETHGIAEGDEVEISSRRGRVVLPAVVTDRVRAGNCFAPFHWNDEHGEYLTVNAVTSDAVDQASLQPEFKFAAVAIRRVGPARDAAPTIEIGMPQPGAARDVLAGIADTAAPVLTEAEGAYVSGFLSALEAAPVAAGLVPVLPAAAPLRDLPRAWFDGVLAGLYSRTALGAAAPGGAQDEVTVLWGSQTGNAEEVAAASRGDPHRPRHPGARRQHGGHVDRRPRSGAAASRRHLDLRRRRPARQRGRPLDLLNARRRRPSSRAWTTPCSRSATPATTTSAAMAAGSTHGSAPSERRRCCRGSTANPTTPSRPPRGSSRSSPCSTRRPTPQRSSSPRRRSALFTRANPVSARARHELLLSAPGSAKEVRQFGFDLSHVGVRLRGGRFPRHRVRERATRSSRSGSM